MQLRAFIPIFSALVFAAPAALAQGKVFSNPGSKVKCFEHVHRCIVPVYVHSLPNRQCTAWIDPELIEVPKPVGVPRIKIVWILRKGDRDTNISEYSFNPANGIKQILGPAGEFTSEGYDGADSDNPNPDFSSSTQQQRYRWTSAQTGSKIIIHYEPLVERKVGSSAIVKCASNDPTITNTN